MFSICLGMIALYGIASTSRSVSSNIQTTSGMTKHGAGLINRHSCFIKLALLLNVSHVLPFRTWRQLKKGLRPGTAPTPHFVRDSCIVIFLVVIQWMHSAYFHWMFCFCYFLSWVYRQAVVHEDEEKNIMADQKEFAPDKKNKKTSPQK